MRILHIAVSGDNDELHKEALEAAIIEIERRDHGLPVYRAWIEKVDSAKDVDDITDRIERVR